MASCETQLWNLVREIEPSQAQKDGAIRSHNYLRDILCTGQMASRIIDHYLSGSYSRDTAIKPLDDVDVIFVIDLSKWTSSLLGFPPPETVLTSFANAIRYRYPVSSVYGQRRSVRLELYHLNIDVVPAINADSRGDFIWIPNKDSSNWIKSSPKKHAENATEVNKLQEGKFKPLVKLLKLWNGNLPSTANFKSFAIETIAVRVFRTIRFQSLEEGLLQFFDFIAYLSGNQTVARFGWKNKCGISFSMFECIVPDAAGTGSNTTADVDEERKKRFIENAVRSRDRMLDAQKTLSVDAACKRVSEALRI